MSKTFIDTNILVYTLDSGDKKRQKQCRGLLQNLARTGEGVLSTQVVQEFYVVATKKMEVDTLTAKNIVSSFNNFEVVQVDFPLIMEAIDISAGNRISFWDALIIVAAKLANCEFVWTEDLSHGQKFGKVTVVNPLKN